MVQTARVQTTELKRRELMVAPDRAVTKFGNTDARRTFDPNKDKQRLNLIQVLPPEPHLDRTSFT